MQKFKDCYVRLDGNRLTVGNAGIERVWDLSAGSPAVISVRDVCRNREWAARAYRPLLDLLRPRPAAPPPPAPVVLEADGAERGGDDA